jgi:hypothetical protein
MAPSELGAVMRARIGTVVIAALLCVLAFGAAGCSGGGSKPAAPDKCGSLAEFAESARQFATFLAGRSFDIGKFAEGDWVRFQVLDLASSPPDEIGDDVHVLADASSKFVDAIAGVDLSNLDQESLEKLQEFWTGIDQQRVKQASQNISAWVRKTCP